MEGFCRWRMVPERNPPPRPLSRVFRINLGVGHVVKRSNILPFFKSKQTHREQQIRKRKKEKGKRKIKERYGKTKKKKTCISFSSKGSSVPDLKKSQSKTLGAATGNRRKVHSRRTLLTTPHSSFVLTDSLAQKTEGTRDYRYVQPSSLKQLLTRVPSP